MIRLERDPAGALLLLVKEGNERPIGIHVTDDEAAQFCEVLGCSPFGCYQFNNIQFDLSTPEKTAVFETGVRFLAALINGKDTDAICPPTDGRKLHAEAEAPNTVQARDPIG